MEALKCQNQAFKKIPQIQFQSDKMQWAISLKGTSAHLQQGSVSVGDGFMARVFSFMVRTRERTAPAIGQGWTGWHVCSCREQDWTVVVAWAPGFSKLHWYQVSWHSDWQRWARTWERGAPVSFYATAQPPLPPAGVKGPMPSLAKAIVTFASPQALGRPRAASTEGGHSLQQVCFNFTSSLLEL